MPQRAGALRGEEKEGEGRRDHKHAEGRGAGLGKPFDRPLVRARNSRDGERFRRDQELPMKAPVQAPLRTTAQSPNLRGRFYVADGIPEHVKPRYGTP